MDRKDGESGSPRITKNVGTTAANNSTITILTKSATTKSRYSFIGGTLGNYLHFSIRNASEVVSIYDGENIPFVYSVERCEEALNMITLSQELNLVRAVRNILKGDVHRSILGKTFNNMQELVKFLRTKYGSRETVYEA